MPRPMLDIQAPIVRHYTGDVQPIQFVVEYDPATNADQPWGVATEDTYDTHHTLDQVLFWELVCCDGRIISEELRAQINTDFEGIGDDG